MQLISKFNKGIRFLLCAIDIFSKHAWVIPLTDEIGIKITNVFQKVLNEANHKTNIIWVDKGYEFYNRSMKSWLQNNNIEIHSIHNQGKSVVAERFIRTLKNKIYKYMTSISKNVYIDIDNSTYQRTIKIKPLNVKLSMYINFNKENNKKGPKFKVADHVIILKYENNFAKGYVPNWSEEVFVIKKVKDTAPWTFFISDFNREEIFGTFYEKELQKEIKKSLELKKIKRKAINCMLNGMVMISLLTNGFIKKT